MSVSYEQAREDFEYLEAQAEVEDMVVIDASVWDLMRNPTKKVATDLYLTSIRLWFAEHCGDFYYDPTVQEIAERYGQNA